MSVKIEISEQESGILGIRVARANRLPEEVNLLHAALHDLGVDVLKLSLTNPERDLYTKLDHIGYPYYVLGMVMTYRTDFTKAKPKDYFHKDLEFVENTGKYDNQVRALVRDIFSEGAASFYANPGLAGRVSEATQLECLAEHIAAMNSSVNPDHNTHLLKVKDRFIGLVSGKRYGTGGEASYAGVVREFQAKGYYIDIVRFIQNYGLQLGQEYGLAHIQLQNNIVHKVLHHERMHPVSHTLNVHVNCFLGK